MRGLCQLVNVAAETNLNRVFIMSTIQSRTVELLGADAEARLSYKCRGFAASSLHLPGPDFVDREVSLSDRTPDVLRNFELILSTGRLGGTGYVSILPVDQGIEHSAGASFAANPTYFD